MCVGAWSRCLVVTEKREEAEKRGSRWLEEREMGEEGDEREMGEESAKGRGEKVWARSDGKERRGRGEREMGGRWCLWRRERGDGDEDLGARNLGASESGWTGGIWRVGADVERGRKVWVEAGSGLSEGDLGKGKGIGGGCWWIEAMGVRERCGR